MNELTQKELDSQLKQHRKWLLNPKKGKQLQLQDAILWGLVCTHLDLTQASFKNCHFTHSKFNNCIFVDNRFTSCRFTNTSFQECDLVDTHFFASSITVGLGQRYLPMFPRAKLIDCTLIDCTIRYSFVGSSLTDGADTENLQIKDCTFQTIPHQVWLGRLATTADMHSDTLYKAGNYSYVKRRGAVEVHDQTNTTTTEYTCEEWNEFVKLQRHQANIQRATQLNEDYED